MSGLGSVGPRAWKALRPPPAASAGASAQCLGPTDSPGAPVTSPARLCAATTTFSPRAPARLAQEQQPGGWGEADALARRLLGQTSEFWDTQALKQECRRKYGSTGPEISAPS